MDQKFWFLRFVQNVFIIFLANFFYRHELQISLLSCVDILTYFFHIKEIEYELCSSKIDIKENN